MYNEPAAVLRFMDGMHSFAKLSARPILTAFDFSRFTTLVDLGGASGALAIEACRMYPQVGAAAPGGGGGLVSRLSPRLFAVAAGMAAGLACGGVAERAGAWRTHAGSSMPGDRPLTGRMHHLRLQMRGIIVDLPNVIDKARQHFTQASLAAGVGRRALARRHSGGDAQHAVCRPP